MELITPGFGLIIWQLLVFIALMFILTKYAWKPILNAVKSREAAIEDALHAADKAREDMKNLQADNAKLIEEARKEREKIVSAAQSAANKVKEDAKAEAQLITDKMIADAQASIEAEKRAALAEVKNQVAEFSVEIAEMVLRKELSSPQAQKELVDSYMADLKTN
ncbi:MULTISPECIES: F0F1 ATP synthase subunit B [Persicobacter]|uniref:ATP synthase subunit b n=1 Tax=Persicobacter diffluens TaxID=981 RepID=A0AAN4W0G2_9BACT|nr:F0F1 ATP synthase subunit B [Persicobacter sp. CCB-QB2]GJM62205.1 ATP synthase subunit b [Persicobacter diffluens]